MRTLCQLDDWYVDGDPILMEATGERSLRITFPGPDRLVMSRLAALWPLPGAVFGEASVSPVPRPI